MFLISAISFTRSPCWIKSYVSSNVDFFGPESFIKSLIKFLHLCYIKNTIFNVIKAFSKHFIVYFSNSSIFQQYVLCKIYIQICDKFIPIPKDTDINLLTEASCKELIKAWQDKPKSFAKSKSTSKSKYKKK